MLLVDVYDFSLTQQLNLGRSTCHTVDGPPQKRFPRTESHSHTSSPLAMGGPTLGMVFSECLG